MLRTIEATIDERGQVTLNEGVALERKSRALVTILDEESREDRVLPRVLSERSLAKDWSRPEEDAAWAYLAVEPGIDEEKA